MTDSKRTNHYFSGGIYRALSGLFGLFLTGLRIYVIFFGVVDAFLRMGIGFIIAVLGAETLWCAIQSKQSWLAKLGPFFNAFLI